MTPYLERSIVAVIALLSAGWLVYVALSAYSARHEDDVEEFKFRRRIRAEADRREGLQ